MSSGASNKMLWQAWRDPMISPVKYKNLSDAELIIPMWDGLVHVASVYVYMLNQILILWLLMLIEIFPVSVL